MVDMLRYGLNPPQIEDCVDLGVVPESIAPTQITNEGRFAGLIDLVGMWGTEIPPHRRAWMVIEHYRNEAPTPWRAEVPGLGTLIYDNDGTYENWEVLK